MEVTNDQVSPTGGGDGDDPGVPPGPSDIYVPDRPPFEELPERAPRAARAPSPPPEPEPLLSRALMTRVGGGLFAVVLALLLRRRRRRRRTRGT